MAPLYPIVDASVDPLEDIGLRIGALASAGCGLVQLRGKQLSERDFFQWAEAAVQAARGHAGFRILINDRVDIAALVGAAGVHLGQEDLSPATAREVLGDAAVIGLSTHNEEQLRLGDHQPVDYLAVGPIFATASKENPDPVVGLERLARCRTLTAKPLVAIGGVSHDNARRVVGAGADSVAVISAIAGLPPEDLAGAAREWMTLLKEGK